MHFICSSQCKFFRAASTRNEADTQFYEPDICFCCSANFVGVKTKLASPPERKTMWCHNNRYRRISCTHHRLLKHADSHIQFIVFLLDGKHEDHANIRASREILTFIRNNETAIFFFCHPDGSLNSFEYLAA